MTKPMTTVVGGAGTGPNNQQGGGPPIIVEYEPIPAVDPNPGPLRR